MLLYIFFFSFPLKSPYLSFFQIFSFCLSFFPTLAPTPTILFRKLLFIQFHCIIRYSLSPTINYCIAPIKWCNCFLYKSFHIFSFTVTLFLVVSRLKVDFLLLTTPGFFQSVYVAILIIFDFSLTRLSYLLCDTFFFFFCLPPLNMNNQQSIIGCRFCNISNFIISIHYMSVLLDFSFQTFFSTFSFPFSFRYFSRLYFFFFSTNSLFLFVFWSWISNEILIQILLFLVLSLLFQIHLPVLCRGSKKEHRIETHWSPGKQIFV